MRFCFILVGSWLLALSAAWGEASGERSRNVTSVVRADPRSGRLVRTVVINRRAAASRARADIDLGRIIEEEAARHEVDPLLVHSMIEVESSYNPFAISPKGAEGLMQLIPSTARRFGVKNSFNFKENITGGVRYLKYLLDRFQNERLAVAAYNAGEEAVQRYGGVPPYPETRNYVRLVTGKYGAAKQSVARVQAGEASTEESHPPVIQFVDEQGRLHIRTR
jgi:soluble lytic murein transglycosylase-like protein